MLKFADANNATKQGDVLAPPGTDEFGTDMKLASPNLSSGYVNTPISTNGSNYWLPDFTWNSTDGYTIGSIHRHQAAGPSPNDVFGLVGNTYDPAFSTDTAGKHFYQNNAYATIVLNTTTYVVTVTNWAKLNYMYTNPTDGFRTHAAAFANTFSSYTADYQRAGMTEAAASIKALMKMFDTAVSVYEAPAGSSGFQIVGFDENGDIKLIPCP